MSVELAGDVVRIVAPAWIEDVEPLFSLLRFGPARTVDLSAAGPLHTAVVQILLAFRPIVAEPPDDPFTAAWLWPLLHDTGTAFAAGAGPVANVLLPWSGEAGRKQT